MEAFIWGWSWRARIEFYTMILWHFAAILLLIWRLRYSLEERKQYNGEGVRNSGATHMPGTIGWDLLGGIYLMPFQLPIIGPYLSNFSGKSIMLKCPYFWSVGGWRFHAQPVCFFNFFCDEIKIPYKVILSFIVMWKSAQ